MYNPEWVKVVRKEENSIIKEFSGNYDKWWKFIHREHGVGWVTEMAGQLAARFYPDVADAENCLQNIAGGMLYFAYCHNEIDQCVSYEFSTDEKYSPVVALFANAFKLKDAHWRWFVCETCHKSINGELTLHVEIENH